jgi:hypothetical protein
VAAVCPTCFNYNQQFLNSTIQQLKMQRIGGLKSLISNDALAAIRAARTAKLGSESVTRMVSMPETCEDAPARNVTIDVSDGNASGVVSNAAMNVSDGNAGGLVSNGNASGAASNTTIIVIDGNASGNEVSTMTEVSSGEVTTMTDVSADAITDGERAAAVLKEVREMLECPTCNMQIPVKGYGGMCKNEHIVCAPCVPRLPRLTAAQMTDQDDIDEAIVNGGSQPQCPMCRSLPCRTSLKPSRWYDNLKDAIDYVCAYECGARGTANYIRLHQVTCKRREVTCPILFCNLHWRERDTPAVRGQERIKDAISTVRARDMVNMLRRDHPDVDVIHAASTRLHIIVASVGENVPQRGCTWSFILHHNDRDVLIQIDWTRTRKYLIASAYALWSDEDFVPITQAEIIIGGPDVKPYQRTIPLQYLADHYEAARAGEMLFVPMDDTVGGVSYFDSYVSKRDAENISRYIYVRVRLAHDDKVLDNSDDARLPIEVVRQTSRNKLLIYRPPPQPQTMQPQQPPPPQAPQPPPPPPPQAPQPPPPPPQAPQPPPPPPPSDMPTPLPPPPAHSSSAVQERERVPAIDLSASNDTSGGHTSSSNDTSRGPVRKLLAPRKEMIRMDERPSTSGTSSRKRSSGHDASSSKRSRRNDSDSDDDFDLSPFRRLFGNRR